MLELGYTDSHGYAEVCRLLLKYFEIPFKDVRYAFGENYEKREWFAVKWTLGMDFPNLPYIIDGDFKISQSQAILKYLANKFGMSKTDIKEKAVEEQLEYQIIDYRARFIRTAYSANIPDDATLKKEIQILATEFKESIKALEKFIGSNKKFITGNELSYVDFLAYEYLGWYREMIDKQIFYDSPNLLRFFKNFESIPNLKDYLASDEYRKGPIMSPNAKFGQAGFVRD